MHDQDGPAFAEHLGGLGERAELMVAEVHYAGAPAAFVDEFRHYYGPTMNAFAAAEKAGRAAGLQRELEELFTSQNRSEDPAATAITATFLRVTVDV